MLLVAQLLTISQSYYISRYISKTILPFASLNDTPHSSVDTTRIMFMIPDSALIYVIQTLLCYQVVNVNKLRKNELKICFRVKTVTKVLGITQYSQTILISCCNLKGVPLLNNFVKAGSKYTLVKNVDIKKYSQITHLKSYHWFFVTIS